MKNSVNLLGLALVCAGAILGQAFLPQFEQSAHAATTFSPMGGPVVYSGNGSIYGTNSGGLYPTSLGANAGAASLIFVGTASRPLSIELQGNTVSGTSTMAVGIWQKASAVTLALNPNTGAITNSTATPLQFVGWLTNNCTTTPSAQVFPITATPATPAQAGGTWVAAGQAFYVGAITNFGTGVLTNYSVSVIGGN